MPRNPFHTIGDDQNDDGLLIVNNLHSDSTHQEPLTDNDSGQVIISHNENYPTSHSINTFHKYKKSKCRFFYCGMSRQRFIASGATFLIIGAIIVGIVLLKGGPGQHTDFSNQAQETAGEDNNKIQQNSDLIHRPVSSTPGMVFNTTTAHIPVSTDTPTILRNDQDKQMCQDLYTLACKSWHSTHEISPAQTSISQFSLASDRVAKDVRQRLAGPGVMTPWKSYYQSCMNWESIEKNSLQDFKFYIWNKLLADFSFSSRIQHIRLSKIVGWLHDIGVDVFFSARASYDPANQTVPVIFFDYRSALESWVGLDVWPITTDHFAQKLRQQTLLRLSNTNDFKTRNIELYHDLIMQTGTVLNLWSFNIPLLNKTEYHLRQSQYNDNVPNTKVYNSSKDNLYPYFIRQSWKEFLDVHVPNNNTDNNKTDLDITLVWDWDEYFTQRGIENISDTFSYVILQDNNVFEWIEMLNNVLHVHGVREYIFSRVIRTFLTAMPMRAYALFEKYVRDLTGRYESSPRWKTCFWHTHRDLPYGAGYEYLSSFPLHVLSQTRNSIHNILNSVRRVFRQTLLSRQKTAWMTNLTRARAVAKLDHIRAHVAYADWMLNLTCILDIYNIVELFPTNFMLNQISMRLLQNLIRGPSEQIYVRPESEAQQFNNNIENDNNDTGPWSTDAAVVNAFYSPSRNSISIPMGILQPPFFFPDDRVKSMAAIGVVIGHELTHAFDDTGSLFDLHGNFNPWMDDISREQFETRSRCIKKQFSSLGMDGNQTLGENIADNGGLERALEASGIANKAAPLSKENATRFFMAFAAMWCEKQTPTSLQTQIKTDPHSPPMYRVNINVRDLPFYNQLYHCNNISSQMSSVFTHDNISIPLSCKVW